MAEPSEENIAAAEGNSLNISMPFLNTTGERHEASSDHTYCNVGHPVTLTSQRYSLTDEFHKKNDVVTDE